MKQHKKKESADPLSPVSKLPTLGPRSSKTKFKKLSSTTPLSPLSPTSKQKEFSLDTETAVKACENLGDAQEKDNNSNIVTRIKAAPTDIEANLADQDNQYIVPKTKSNSVPETQIHSLERSLEVLNNSKPDLIQGENSGDLDTLVSAEDAGFSHKDVMDTNAKPVVHDKSHTDTRSHQEVAMPNTVFLNASSEMDKELIISNPLDNLHSKKQELAPENVLSSDSVKNILLDKSNEDIDRNPADGLNVQTENVAVREKPNNEETMPHKDSFSLVKDFRTEESNSEPNEKLQNLSIELNDSKTSSKEEPEGIATVDEAERSAPQQDQASDSLLKHKYLQAESKEDPQTEVSNAQVEKRLDENTPKAVDLNQDFLKDNELRTDIEIDLPNTILNESQQKNEQLANKHDMSTTQKTQKGSQTLQVEVDRTEIINAVNKEGGNEDLTVKDSPFVRHELLIVEELSEETKPVTSDSVTEDRVTKNSSIKSSSENTLANSEVSNQHDHDHKIVRDEDSCVSEVEKSDGISLEPKSTHSNLELRLDSNMAEQVNEETSPGEETSSTQGPSAEDKTTDAGISLAQSRSEAVHSFSEVGSQSNQKSALVDVMSREILKSEPERANGESSKQEDQKMITISPQDEQPKPLTELTDSEIVSIQTDEQQPEAAITPDNLREENCANGGTTKPKPVELEETVIVQEDHKVTKIKTETNFDPTVVITAPSFKTEPQVKTETSERESLSDLKHKLKHGDDKQEHIMTPLINEKEEVEKDVSTIYDDENQEEKPVAEQIIIKIQHQDKDAREIIQKPELLGNKSRNLSETKDFPSGWLDVENGQKLLRKKGHKRRFDTSVSEDESLEPDDLEDFIQSIKKGGIPFSLPPKRPIGKKSQSPPFVMPAIKEDHFERTFDPEQFQFGLGKNDFFKDLTPSMAIKRTAAAKEGLEKSTQDNSLPSTTEKTKSLIEEEVEDGSQNEAGQEDGPNIGNGKPASRLGRISILSSLLSSPRSSRKNKEEISSALKGTPSAAQQQDVPTVEKQELSLLPDISANKEGVKPLDQSSPLGASVHSESTFSPSSPPFPSFSEIKLPDHLEKYVKKNKCEPETSKSLQETKELKMDSGAVMEQALTSDKTEVDMSLKNPKGPSPTNHYTQRISQNGTTQKIKSKRKVSSRYIHSYGLQL